MNISGAFSSTDVHLSESFALKDAGAFPARLKVEHSEDGEGVRSYDTFPIEEPLR
jgi:hypothetical protein